MTQEILDCKFVGVDISIAGMEALYGFCLKSSASCKLAPLPDLRAKLGQEWIADRCSGANSKFESAEYAPSDYL